MPIPFFTPLTNWAVDVFELRENNKLLNTYSNPWIVVSSGARVIKSNPFTGNAEERAQQIYNILEEKITPEKIYKGCILSNFIGMTNLDQNIPENKQFLNNGGTMNFSYSLGNTPVGIDFDGKIITVDDEIGRKVSMPIIESMDLDTDGANNMLKTCKVNIRCFTLKQLEMLELFFMKPGMNILIEFGDSALQVLKNNQIVTNSTNIFNPTTQSDVKWQAYFDGELKPFKPYDSVTEALVPKSDYKTFCTNFSKYFRCDVEAIGNYLEAIRRSIGSYDRVAGKVIDYSFSIEADGTYLANISVSQSNQLAFAIPKTKPKAKGKQKGGKAVANNFNPYDVIKNIIITDFNLDKDAYTRITENKQLLPPGKKNWNSDFFNFLKTNDKQKDNVASDVAYVSLRWVLTILGNYVVGDECSIPGADFFELTLPEFKENASDPDNKLIKMIPVPTHEYLISSTEDVIYPRNPMPKPIQPDTKKNPDATEIILTIPQNKPVDGSINGYLFDTKYKQLYAPGSYYCDSTPRSITPNITGVKEPKYGDALNIFVKYKKIVEFWRSSFTRIDFLENVISMVNKNSYGLFQLIVGLPVQDGKPTVYDIKGFSPDVYIQDQPKGYRFKMTTVKSAVKDFSFNFEMSNLVAGMTIFNDRKKLVLAKQKAAASGSLYTLPLPPQAYKAVDNSLYANADGYFSLNEVEYINLQAVKEVLDKKQKENIDQEEEKKDEATKETTNLSDVLKDKSVNFKTDTGTKLLIYKDADLIYKKISDEEKNPKPKTTVTPITVTFTISGFSGISSGQYFHIDGVPEIYNTVGVFQVKNIKHNITKEGWKTTIEADFKVMNLIK